MFKEKSTRASNWKAVKTMVTMTKAMKMSGSSSQLAEKKKPLSKSSKLNQHQLRDKILSESRRAILKQRR